MGPGLGTPNLLFKCTRDKVAWYGHLSLISVFLVTGGKDALAVCPGARIWAPASRAIPPEHCVYGLLTDIGPRLRKTIVLCYTMLC